MLGGSSVDGERDTDDDAAGAVAAPPAIDFPAEVSDPKYDESDVPAELQVLKEPLQQPTFPFLVANQLLLVSLLEHLSHVHEPNPLHSKQVFKLLCQTFIKMGPLSSFTCSDEFSSLRLHHNRAITHLMRSAKERVRQDPCQDNSYMQKIRSREIAFEAQTSRYLNEFEELAILGKGGYGRVYKVRNKLDGQHYAIKKILIKSATKTVLTGVRTGRIPESLSKRCPVQAKYIQLLTGRNVSQRPSALQLLQSELFQTTGNVNLTLQMKIIEQEKEIEELKKQLSLLSQDRGLKR